MVTYANLTILLADVHIDSGYLVVVTKDGADCENESDNGIKCMESMARDLRHPYITKHGSIGMVQVPRHRSIH